MKNITLTLLLSFCIGCAAFGGQSWIIVQTGGFEQDDGGRAVGAEAQDFDVTDPDANIDADTAVGENVSQLDSDSDPPENGEEKDDGRSEK